MRVEGVLGSALSLVWLLPPSCAGAGATAADALLFARFGVSALPQLYLALGVVSFACALGVSVVFGAVRRERVYPVTLVAVVGGRGLLRSLAVDPRALWYPGLGLRCRAARRARGAPARG